jgi:hypothetical protein
MNSFVKIIIGLDKVKVLNMVEQQYKNLHFLRITEIIASF